MTPQVGVFYLSYIPIYNKNQTSVSKSSLLLRKRQKQGHHMPFTYHLLVPPYCCKKKILYVHTQKGDFMGQQRQQFS
jgi:hypothetical protein